MKVTDLLSRYTTAANFRLETTTEQAGDLADFKKHLTSYTLHNNQTAWSRYSTVADAVDLPPALIAAIHWRESGGQFDTYLAQGDTLGVPAIHEPLGQPVRGLNEWELAAQDALTLSGKKANQIALDLTKDSARDIPKLLAYAEAYNGMGYAFKGVPSPYCLAGTTGYQGGKYVADHIYDPRAHDSQIGVLAMLWAVVTENPNK